MASLHVADQQLTLSVRRERSHVYLPEYNRTAILSAPERELSCVLFEDTGGTVRINVYRASRSRYILRDRVGALEINRELGRDCSDVPLPEVTGIFVGAFDEVDGDWRFLSPSDRAELKLNDEPAK